MEALHNIKEPLEELNSMIGILSLKENIVDQILQMSEGLKCQVLAPVIRARKGEFLDLFKDFTIQGYVNGVFWERNTLNEQSKGNHLLTVKTSLQAYQKELFS